MRICAGRARIDRIAEMAAANKRSIYWYFQSKEKLFDAALHHVLTRMIEDVPLIEEDLPDYAGRLFDYHLSRPQGFRMNLWRQLERPGSPTTTMPRASRPSAGRLSLA